MINPNCKIVMIDDDRSFNLISSYSLKKLLPQIDVVTFTEPATALAYISKPAKPPADTVLFLDINMPELTGWDVLEQLSALGKDVLASLQVYILSSSIDPHDKERAEAHPLVTAYIRKPLSKSVIEDIFMAA
ncbi:MAG: response regulator [Bacteroidota bacterium]